jgi:hypothetical protein
MDVRRHDLAAHDAETIERTARRLARAFGYGQTWAMHAGAPGAVERHADATAPTITLDDPATVGIAKDELEHVHEYDGGVPNDALPVVKEGRRARPAKCDADADAFFAQHGERVMRRTLRYQNKAGGRQSILRRPAHRMDVDALAALGALPRLQQSMLLTYAGELHHWPHVARWCMARGHRIEAACAAMDRILWKRPDRTLAAHAWHIGMRQSAFRALVHLARSDLDRLLLAASRQFMATLNGTRKHHCSASLCRGKRPDRRSLPVPLRRAA